MKVWAVWWTRYEDNILEGLYATEQAARDVVASKEVEIRESPNGFLVYWGGNHLAWYDSSGQETVLDIALEIEETHRFGGEFGGCGYWVQEIEVQE